MSKTRILGDNLILSASYDDGTTYEAIGIATEHTLTINQDSIDAACKEDGVWNNAIPGNLSWSVSVSGLHAMASDGTSTFTKIFGLQKSRAKIRLKIYLRDSADIESPDTTTDSYVYEGEASIDSLEQSASKGAVATFSASFTGAGELTEKLNDV